MSEGLSVRELRIYDPYTVEKLSVDMQQKSIKIKGFVSAIRHNKNTSFFTIRDQFETVQAVAWMKGAEPEFASKIMGISTESFVEVMGTVAPAKDPITSCTKSDFEIQISDVRVISPVIKTLPFNIKDAGATEKERANNKSLCNVSYGLRLDHRFLDMRVPSTLAVIRLVDGAMAAFRDFLRKRKFLEIKTTKIIKSGSEGGSNLFQMDYFGKTAFLAQSPQLYKQMAIAGGLQRVYEIGHVYRAEVSNTNRYLSEFTGVDIEMELEDGFEGLIKFVYSMVCHVMKTLEEDYRKEMDILREYKHFVPVRYPAEPVIMTHREAVDILRDMNYEIGYEDDFNKEMEVQIGQFVAKKYSSDIVVITEYPIGIRAFYTYYDESAKRSCSFDVLLRGEEILSASRRITDPAKLAEAIAARELSPESLSFYVDCFNYGVPPHGGCGIGLERFLKTFLGMDDIRMFALYPRDPTRINP